MAHLRPEGAAVATETYRRPARVAPTVLPKLPANAPFLLAVHPHRWQVDVTMGRVLPDPITISLQDGANHTGRSHDSEITESRFGAEGWLVLPERVGDYVQRTTVRGGHHYHTRWQQPIPGTDRVRVDSDGWREWLASLVDDGIVDPPAPYVLEMGIEAAEQAHQQDLRGEGPIAKARAAKSAEVLRIWRAALDAATADPEPIPESKPPARRAARKPAAAKE